MAQHGCGWLHPQGDREARKQPAERYHRIFLDPRLTHRSGPGSRGTGHWLRLGLPAGHQASPLPQRHALCRKDQAARLLCLHPAPPSSFLPPPPSFGRARLTRRGGMRFRRERKAWLPARDRDLRGGGGAGRLPEGVGGPSLRPRAQEPPRPAERPRPADTARDQPRSRRRPTPARDPPRGGTRRSPSRARAGRTLAER